MAKRQQQKATTQPVAEQPKSETLVEKIAHAAESVVEAVTGHKSEPAKEDDAAAEAEAAKTSKQTGDFEGHRKFSKFN